MIGIKNEKLGLALISLTALFTLIWILTQDPVPQEIDYHNFKDTDSIFGIPNFWNVLSNIPFLLVGVLGLNKIIKGKLQISDEFRMAYILLFVSLSLVSFGSGFYHLEPNNQTLVWDRLAMTIAFMSLFLILIGEFISPRIGKTFLIPAILIGISSVLYWQYTETIGKGDLRFYLLIQFLPILLTPIILIFFRSHYTKPQAYWWLLFAYIAAKIFESYDEVIYDTIGFISGHSLKHFAAALGFYILLVAYERRHLN